MNSEQNSFPLGRRINVIGKGGKTTLSKALADKYGLDFIEQDAIKHQAGWVELPHDEHQKRALEAFEKAEVGWVSDGNYSGIQDAVFEQVETVIALALPWRVMLWRTFKRTVLRRIRGEVLWNGNRESFRSAFLSRDSVVYDLWRRRERFRTFAESAERDVPDNVNLIIIRSSKELDEFYAKYGLVRR